MNKVTLSGRLTKDIELKQSKDVQYARFSVAVNKDRREGVDFINCVTFGKQAEAMAKYCQKGRMLLIDGRLQVSQNNGRTYYTVVATQVEFLAKAKNDQSNGQLDVETVPVDELVDQDLPF
ncbi:single-stranded DNA-binding protein [Lactobacillaceae bacterium Melli_B4]